MSFDWAPLMFAVTAVVQITDEKCVGCRRCTQVCPSGALEMEGRLARLDESKCVGCFKCVEACIPYDAISIRSAPDPRVLSTATDETNKSLVETLCAKARFKADARICVCTGTTAAEVAAAIVDGVHEPEELALATGVRSKCGMWCLAPTMRLLEAHGIAVERSSKDHRIYPDGAGSETAIWTISDEVADKYPEYRVRESRAAVEDGTNLNSPTPWFPDIQPRKQQQ